MTHTEEREEKCRKYSLQFCVLFQTCVTKNHIIKHDSSKNDDTMV